MDFPFSICRHHDNRMLRETQTNSVMDQQYIENSILCFMNSSKDDVPAATALDMIISFYSQDRRDKESQGTIV